MARRIAKSALLGKINSALQEHSGDETEQREKFIDLPPGIQNGVAELVDAKVGEYKTGDNQGKQFLYLAGVIIEPVNITYVPSVFKDGKVLRLEPQIVTVEGQRTSLMVPLCDTKNFQGEVVEVGEHIEKALNDLRCLGLDTTEITKLDDLVELLDLAKGAGIYFSFGTSSSTPTKAYPSPRVWENWYGVIEGYSPDVGDDVVDDTEEGVDNEEPVEGKEEENQGETEETTEGTEAEDTSEEDGEKADAGDEEAQARLTEIAQGLKIDPDEYATWVEVWIAIGEATAGEGKDVPPEVDDQFGYKPPRKRKIVSCVVTAVFADKRICNLKTLDAGVSYKGVSWDDLVELE